MAAQGERASREGLLGGQAGMAAPRRFSPRTERGGGQGCLTTSWCGCQGRRWAELGTSRAPVAGEEDWTGTHACRSPWAGGRAMWQKEQFLGRERGASLQKETSMSPNPGKTGGHSCSGKAR